MPFLAQLGFLLLMFQAGMEIDVALLVRQRKRQMAFQLMVFAATVCLSWAAASFFKRGFYLALVLSTTSLGLVVPTLKEAIILLAVMTCLLGPSLFKLLFRPLSLQT